MRETQRHQLEEDTPRAATARPGPCKETAVQRLAALEPPGPPQEAPPRSTAPAVRAPDWLPGSELQAALGMPAVQRRAAREEAGDATAAHGAAQRGVSGPGAALPFAEQLQRSFGAHQLGDVRAHTGDAARQACDELGASAYATGSDIAFASTPDLRTAAHEAAHVVQQRAGVQLLGGVGQTGDVYEQHADRVAEQVVRGESAEVTLDELAGGGGQRRAVQRNNAERDRTERAQDWDPAISGPLDAGAASSAEGDVAAIQATVALGLTDDKILRLRSALGIPARPRTGAAIDRALVQAVRARQGDGGTGVIDEPTVFAIDLGASWPHLDGAPAHYRRNPPWAGMDAELLARVRATALPRLHAEAGDLAGPPAVATLRLAQQVVNWQFLARAAEATVAWGRLSARDLRDLGVELPDTAASVEPTDGTAAPAPESEPEEAANGEGLDTTEDEEGGEDESGLAPEVRRELTDLRTEARRLGRTSSGAAASAERIGAILTRVQTLGVYNEWIRAAESAARAHMKARWTADGISAAFGEEVRPISRAAAPARATADHVGTVPGLERHTAEEARLHLEEAHVGVDTDAEGHLEERELRRGEEGWDGRVLAGGRASEVAATEEVAVAAAEIVPELERVRAQMLGWKTRLDEAFAAPERIGPVLAQLRDAQPFRIPRTLRRPWRPSLPRALAESQWATTALARQTDRQWSRALNSAAGEAQRQITLHQRYQRGSLRVTRDAVRVDFSRTGVRVNNNVGRQLGPSEMHLQVQFADAMLRFLEMVRGLGATEMWTAGFLREPISPDDTHPMGRACDITGFRFGDQLLHLRNGGRDPAGYPEGVEPRFSDWYNHRARLGGQTYSEILHALTARMATYFSRIVGPGHDSAHAAHWHVELGAGDPRGTRILALQDAPPEAAAGDEGEAADGPAEVSGEGG